IEVKTTDNKSVRDVLILQRFSGGALQVYVSQPLDTVKVKQQAFPKLYKNMFDCFLKTYRQDGIYRGLYAGSIAYAMKIEALPKIYPHATTKS
ncbi:hypothetical protein DOY81_012940, partial [Sarcophaga bullata]